MDNFLFVLFVMFVLFVGLPFVVSVLDVLSERRFKNRRLSREWCMRNHPTGGDDGRYS